ncbi:MAG: VWA domain-containing protein [Chlorobium sp.]|uniref:VWA domain-containing protein n=1 Tax=Chlorobium sp. TaxID=1095 RepID=UPI0025BC29C7|nr:VWA domain-containing protein [Chlorobium sp.]MCF8383282.1 VWA domain-containing protein [Chlorobium sp.]
MQEWLTHIPRIGLEEPLWLLLFPVLALAAWWTGRQEKKGLTAAVMFPDVDRLRRDGFEAPLFLRRLPGWLRWAALVLSVAAMTRPHLVLEETVAEARGIDVVLVLDISGSMEQQDAGGRSRLDALREVAREFIGRHPDDRIGVVVFKGEAYTLCPLTLDHRVTRMLLDAVSPEVVRNDGTAIGTAVLVAVNRLRVSQSAQKVMILFSDGSSNAGQIDPLTAASFAAAHGIRIYTVGAGSGGSTASSFDEEELRSIARTGGGRYFRAGSRASLAQTFESIDRLEKSTLSSPVTRTRSGLFVQLLVVALVLLLVEAVLANTRLLRVP